MYTMVVGVVLEVFVIVKVFVVFGGGDPEILSGGQHLQQ